MITRDVIWGNIRHELFNQIKNNIPGSISDMGYYAIIDRYDSSLIRLVNEIRYNLIYCGEELYP